MFKVGPLRAINAIINHPKNTTFNNFNIFLPINKKMKEIISTDQILISICGLDQILPL